MKAIKIIITVLFVFGAFSFAGRADFAEVVVMEMPNEAYEAICVKLPNGASDYDIATEYISNKEYYDGLAE